MDDRLPCAFSETAVVNAVFHMGIKFQDLLFFLSSARQMKEILNERLHLVTESSGTEASSDVTS